MINCECVSLFVDRSPEKQNLALSEDEGRNLRKIVDSSSKSASTQDGMDGKKQQQLKVAEVKSGGISQSKSHDSMAGQQQQQQKGASASHYPISGRRSTHRHHSGHGGQRRSSDMSVPQEGTYYRNEAADLSNFPFPDNVAMYDYSNVSAMALPTMDFNQQVRLRFK